MFLETVDRNTYLKKFKRKEYLPQRRQGAEKTPNINILLALLTNFAPLRPGGRIKMNRK
jgi:hypothetical protein